MCAVRWQIVQYLVSCLSDVGKKFALVVYTSENKIIYHGN